MDNTASFKINRGIVTHLKLFPLFGEYNNTLIWALLANDYIKNAGYTLRQARVITQYKKYKRTVSDVERLVVYYDDLEYLFKTRLIIYEGDYSEARVHGKSIIPSTVRIIYDGSEEQQQRRAVEYDSTTYIYRIYKDEWIPNKSQHLNGEYMYVLIPDHDAFISRFEGMKIVSDEYCKEVMGEERREERSDEQRQRREELRQRREEEQRLYKQRQRRDMYNTVIRLTIAEHTDCMIPQWLFSY